MQKKRIRDENMVLFKIVLQPWNNGNRDPGGGVAELQKMSPPTTVGDAAVMLSNKGVLGNVAFFVTDLLTLARCAQ